VTEPVARVVGVSLDCADPRELADFSVALLGGREIWATDSSVGVAIPGVALNLQRVESYLPPVWPGASIVHLELTSDDIPAAASRAVALGASRPEQPDPRWVVLLDPAGHPFCLTPITPPGY
jgi:hypothetical protein